jgi:hypothetical protein
VTDNVVVIFHFINKENEKSFIFRNTEKLNTPISSSRERKDELGRKKIKRFSL